MSCIGRILVVGLIESVTESETIYSGLLSVLFGTIIDVICFFIRFVRIASFTPTIRISIVGMRPGFLRPMGHVTRSGRVVVRLELTCCASVK